MMAQPRIMGTVSPGYEPVRDMFQKCFEDGLEDEAQMCAYVDGKMVVDLWGVSAESASSGTEYTGDTLANVFSSSKALTAICIACMVDKGLLDYDEKVCTYWPEFGQHGKDTLTLADILRHEGGMATLDVSLSLDNLQTEAIKNNAIGEIIEGQKPRFPQHSKREYHSFTRGLILNEIFRRVEPQGRTVGEYLRQEISRPLEADAYVGLLDGELDKIIDIKCYEGRPNSLPHIDASDLMGPLPVLEAPTISFDLLRFFNTQGMRQAEISSTNGSCSARGLAKIGACIVNGGELNGVRIASEDAIFKMQEKPVAATMVYPFKEGKSEQTQGGFHFFGLPADLFVPQPERSRKIDGCCGGTGVGGSVFSWHQEMKISFAFVPTQLRKQNRGAEFMAVLAGCAGKFGEDWDSVYELLMQ